MPKKIHQNINLQRISTELSIINNLEIFVPFGCVTRFRSVGSMLVMQEQHKSIAKPGPMNSLASNFKKDKTWH